MSRHFDDAEGLHEQRDPATDGYVFNQTMLHIKDPERLPEALREHME